MLMSASNSPGISYITLAIIPIGISTIYNLSQISDYNVNNNVDKNLNQFAYI